MDSNTLGRAAFAFTVLLGALGMVTWRQSRALEALASLDDLRTRTSVARAERIELERTVQVLESRQRVVPEAREHLGMHLPTGPEQVLLPGGLTP